MVKILILIGGHLCNAPRPQKEADTFARAGHDVIVKGFWFDAEFARRDLLIMEGKNWHFSPIIDLRPQNRSINFIVRLQARIAKEFYKRLKYFTPPLLGFSPQAMLRVARQLKADLTIVHSEGGLWVGNQLINEGLNVGVDFEDWFSEDLLPDARAIRPIALLKQLEARLIRECKYCITTSEAIAKAMAKAYEAPKPTVIYNAFPWVEREKIDGKFCDRKNLDIPSLHWFSQTIGPGRGLEMLAESLHQLHTKIEIYLRGNTSEYIHAWLDKLISPKWKSNIFIKSTVPNNQLLSRIAEHDIGLALEVSNIPNKKYTISNKMFQYLQGGLAIIATDTAGQREIFDQFPNVGYLIPCNNSQAFIKAVMSLLGNPKHLASAKASALEAAKQLCWENQEHKILALLDQSLAMK